MAREKDIKSRLGQLKTQARQQLAQRKGQLSLLLATEHEEYKRCIENMQETSEQVQQKMRERVQELKAKREGNRIEYVNTALEKVFRENCDELRQIGV